MLKSPSWPLVDVLGNAPSPAPVRTRLRSRLFFNSLLAAYCLLWLPGAAAQEPPGSPGSPTAAEMVTEYLQQDIFLRPGVGLDAVRVGTPFEQVLRAWGRPTGGGNDNLINTKWTYEVANHTTITLIGDDSVERMHVAGGIGSPFVTTEGASFGMARHQLAMIYGAAKMNDNQVTYRGRGIGFVLRHGQVSEIRVFPAEE